MAALADRPNDPRQEQTLGRRGQQHLQVFDVAGEDSMSAALPSLRGGEFYSDFFDLLRLVFVFIPFAFLLPNRMFDGIDSVVDLFVRGVVPTTFMIKPKQLPAHPCIFCQLKL